MRPEKMVNLLLAEGISLHNIERENKSTITAVTETESSRVVRWDFYK